MAYVAKKDNIMVMILRDDDPCINPRVDYDNLGKMACWHSRYNLGDEHDFKDPNEFLMNLVLETLSSDAIIKTVKDGNVKDLKLEYDRSEKGWQIKSYYEPTQKWCDQDFFEGTLEENKDDIAESLVNEMSNDTLMVLAKTKNEILPLYLYDHSGITMNTTGFHCPWDSGQVGWTYVSHTEIEKQYYGLNPQTIERANNTLVGEVKDYDSYLTGDVYGFRYFENGEESDSCWGFLGEVDNFRDEITEYLPEGYETLLDNLIYIEESQVDDYEREYEEEMEVG